MSRLKCTPCSSYRDLEQQAGCRVTITEMTRRTELALLCDRTREMEAGLWRTLEAEAWHLPRSLKSPQGLLCFCAVLQDRKSGQGPGTNCKCLALPLYCHQEQKMRCSPWKPAWTRISSMVLQKQTWKPGLNINWRQLCKVWKTHPATKIQFGCSLDMTSLFFMSSCPDTNPASSHNPLCMRKGGHEPSTNTLLQRPMCLHSVPYTVPGWYVCPVSLPQK